MRPEIPWRTDTPPSSEKVISLTKFGVLNVGHVSHYEWETGFVVCWQRCPKKPSDWDELLESSKQRRTRWTVLKQR